MLHNTVTLLHLYVITVLRQAFKDKVFALLWSRYSYLIIFSQYSHILEN